MTELADYVPLTEAARLKGYASNSTYRAWAKAGRIPGAMKVGRDWVLPRAWVDAQPEVDKTGGRVGKPRGKKINQD